MQVKAKLETEQRARHGSAGSVSGAPVKKIKLARELSDLVGIVQAVHFKGWCRAALHWLL